MKFLFFFFFSVFDSLGEVRYALFTILNDFEDKTMTLINIFYVIGYRVPKNTLETENQVLYEGKIDVFQYVAKMN